MFLIKSQHLMWISILHEERHWEIFELYRSAEVVAYFWPMVYFPIKKYSSFFFFLPFHGVISFQHLFFFSHSQTNSFSQLHKCFPLPLSSVMLQEPFPLPLPLSGMGFSVSGTLSSPFKHHVHQSTSPLDSLLRPPVTFTFKLWFKL